MSDPSSEEAWERLLVESLLKLSGEHSVTHHEPLQPVVMQPVKPRTFPVLGPTDRLSYIIRCYGDGIHGRNTRTLTHHNFRPRALTTGCARMRPCRPDLVLGPFHLLLVAPMICRTSSDHSGRDDSS
ncbi:unnamed protein product [Parnassius apollo]|uniref:(apollo) hypothetical protein n=1 Tax=Parnassius apollo TaxID=110799 RepID=A0A8S3X7Q3_PARAO|nr:unnamed protein product [Parnassius apollo]CAG5007770.1 unnamed protein product [Parnassius apollo]